MALHFKVVIDCQDPNGLAAFWAAALGYVVEDNIPLIDQLIATGAVPEEATLVIDGRRAWRDLAAVRHPDDDVQPHTGIGLGRRLLFQAVPEPKTGKNRLHLDLHVGRELQAQECARLEALGAQVLRHVDDRGSQHITLADPEGNEFDLE